MTQAVFVVAVQQLIAPGGYGALRAGVTYCILRSPSRGRLLLISFTVAKSQKAKMAEASPVYVIDFLSRESYERGLVAGRLRLLPPEEMLTLPPWLEKLTGTDFDGDDRFIKLRKEGDEHSHADHVDQRVIYLAPALAMLNEILAADSPERILKKIARSFKAPHTQNEGRYCLWFFVYLAFGANRWSLLPPFHIGGAWDRNSSEAAMQPLGEKWRVNAERKAQIIQSFENHGKKGRFRHEVYEIAMVKDFGCVITRDANNRPVPKNADGEPIPLPDIYWYHVEEHYTKEEVDRRLLGDQKQRHERAVPQGSYSEAVTDAREVINWDVSFTKDQPRGYLENHALPKLPIAEAIDAACGYCLGVGTSIGGESAAAYNAALFCMAIRKSKFGEIIGYPIDDDEWPGHGFLGLEYVSDRGKGRAKRVKLALAEFLAGMEGTPTYTPQSNAPAESRHDRSRHTDGPPEHQKSHLTPIQLFWRHVERVMTRNRSSTVFARRTPGMVKAKVKTPLDMFRFLVERGRVTGIPITFEQAVRRFLVRVEFQVIDGHLTLHGMRYRSKALLKDPSWVRHVRAWEGTTLFGYVLEISVRKAWMDIDGRLIEVDAVPPIHGSKKETYLSLPELIEVGKEGVRLEKERRRDQTFENIDAMNRFKAKSQKDWYGGTTVRGAAKKTKAVKDEVRNLKA